MYWRKIRRVGLLSSLRRSETEKSLLVEEGAAYQTGRAARAIDGRGRQATLRVDWEGRSERRGGEG
jgi:hypothetical protein